MSSRLFRLACGVCIRVFEELLKFEEICRYFNNLNFILQRFDTAVFCKDYVICRTDA